MIHLNFIYIDGQDIPVLLNNEVKVNGYEVTFYDQSAGFPSVAIMLGIMMVILHG